jgi:hypothetical protein
MSEKEPKSAFSTMGTSASSGFKDASAEASKNTKLVKKGNAAAGDPSLEAKPARKESLREKQGARYAIRVKLPGGTSPEAGQTQANGRIIPPAVNRTKPNFSDGMVDHN